MDLEKARALRVQRCDELSKALALVAKHSGHDDSKERGEQVKRRILRAIEYKKGQKLKEWRRQRIMEPWFKEHSKPKPNWAAHLVRLQSIGGLRGQKRHTPIVEKRAIQILCGTR